MKNAIFKVALRVRFADCDPAGVVFYPRYFEMINTVIEEWFADALDWSFTYIIMERKEGLPTVDVDCQFFSPSQMGDKLDFELSVTSLGKSSISVEIKAFNQSKPVLKATHVLVYVSLEAGMKSVEVPASLRRQMMSYVAQEKRVEDSSSIRHTP